MLQKICITLGAYLASYSNEIYIGTAPFSDAIWDEFRQQYQYQRTKKICNVNFHKCRFNAYFGWLSTYSLKKKQQIKHSKQLTITNLKYYYMNIYCLVRDLSILLTSHKFLWLLNESKQLCHTIETYIHCKNSIIPFWIHRTRTKIQRLILYLKTGFKDFWIQK